MQTAHSSYYQLQQVDCLIVSCGGKDLEEFVRKAAKNASYTSTDAVTDFVEAIGVWVDELQVNRVAMLHFSA